MLESDPLDMECIAGAPGIAYMLLKAMCLLFHLAVL